MKYVRKFIKESALKNLYADDGAYQRPLIGIKPKNNILTKQSV